MSVLHLDEIALVSLGPFDVASSSASAITLEQRPSNDGQQNPPFIYTLDVVEAKTVRVRLGRKGRDGVLQDNLKADLPLGACDELEVRPARALATLIPSEADLILPPCARSTGMPRSFVSSSLAVSRASSATRRARS